MDYFEIRTQMSLKISLQKIIYSDSWRFAADFTLQTFFRKLGHCTRERESAALPPYQISIRSAE